MSTSMPAGCQRTRVHVTRRLVRHGEPDDLAAVALAAREDRARLGDAGVGVDHASVPAGQPLLLALGTQQWEDARWRGVQRLAVLAGEADSVLTGRMVCSSAEKRRMSALHP